MISVRPDNSHNCNVWNNGLMNHFSNTCHDDDGWTSLPTKVSNKGNMFEENCNCHNNNNNRKDRSSGIHDVQGGCQSEFGLSKGKQVWFVNYPN